MHYTQIASVSQRLGIVPADTPSLHIAMSSSLSADIRANPDSQFVRDRPGVYALATRGLTGRRRTDSHDVDASAMLDGLHSRTGIVERSELLNKALYLTGRTLDMAERRKVIHYVTLDLQQRIDINISELAREFAMDVDELATDLVYEFPRVLKKAKQAAFRLGFEEVSLVIPLSLFLLELAVDLLGNDTVLVVASANSSIKVPVRSESGNEISHN